MRTLPPCTSDRARGSGPLGDLARLRNLAGFLNYRGLTAQATAVTLRLQKRQPQLDSLSTCEFPRELCMCPPLSERTDRVVPAATRTRRSHCSPTHPPPVPSHQIMYLSPSHVQGRRQIKNSATSFPHVTKLNHTTQGVSAPFFRQQSNAGHH